MKKHVIYGILIAVIAGFGGYGYGKNFGIGKMLSPNASPSVSAPPSSGSPSLDAANPPRSTPVLAPQKPVNSAPKVTRMQLTQCIATPNIVTQKLGTYFAIDNLDSTSRKVSVDSQVFFVQPKEYVTPMALHVGTHSVECDGVGVATLVVKP